MAHQFSYDNRGGKPWPEKQFMEVLKDRKVGTVVVVPFFPRLVIVLAARAAQQTRSRRS
jgi:hypothetical protein